VPLDPTRPERLHQAEPIRAAYLGGTPLVVSPADFGKLITEEIDKWGQVIRAANIKPE